MLFEPNKSDPSLVCVVILQIYALIFARKPSGEQRTGSFWKLTMMLIVPCTMATLLSKPSTTNLGKFNSDILRKTVADTITGVPRMINLVAA